MASLERIRTPDQRLRVFVSSTLGELAAERQAARRAIERLHLTPVMFELGARPHAPRELYRAYLRQSQVFVGIYWQRYGWVAPGEAVSGLEDEYRLAGERPRLLYLKQPADREPRLGRLVEDFASDDLASYKHFTTAEELERLVADDLAVLLSERFEAPLEHGDVTAAPLPAPPTPLVGRAAEVDAVRERLAQGARLVTLTGTGGIGKTRLAIEAASALERPVAFVALADATDADRALRTVADRLGARTDGQRSPLDVVAEHLRHRPHVLLLDNLEQIDGIEAAVAALLDAVPEVQVLATSRRALRIRAEHEVPVPPLALVAAPADRRSLAPAVQLFLDRAAAVAARIDPDGPDGAVVAEICRRLDGIPLAIELAAARTRLLSPSELLSRLSDRLSILVGGGPEVPARQRTLRDTIEWSYDLLDERARVLLARLSVFDGGFTPTAAEVVCRGGLDVLEAMATLLDSSLITPVHEAGAEPRFTLFATVRAYAAERLAERAEEQRVADRLLDHLASVAEAAQPGLCGPGQREWVARLDPERPNLRRAVRHALDGARHATVVELAWDVIVLYFVRDAVDEPAAWLAEVAAARPALDPVTSAKLRSLHALTRIHRGDYAGVRADLTESLAVFEASGMDFETAVALHQLGFVHYHRDGDAAAAVAALRRSSALFDSIGHDWGVALAEAMLGSILAAEGRLDAADTSQRRSLERARTIGNEPLEIQALQHLAFVRLLEQHEDEAFALLQASSTLLRSSPLRTEAAYCLDALALVALVRDDLATAAAASAMAHVERERLGIAPWPSLEPSIRRVTAAARRRLGPAAFDTEIAEARRRDVFAVLSASIAAMAAG